MAPVIYRFPTLHDMAAAAADAMTAALKDAIGECGRASIAVSGGRTPRCIFPLMASGPLDWAKITVTLTDDRWVDTDHGESNEKLARDFLLNGNGAAAGFIGLKSSGPRPRDGLAETEARLNNISWPLDVVFLGLGKDGHIASIFPGESISGNANGKLAIAVGGRAARLARISLAPAALLDSRLIVLVLSGEEKNRVFQEALKPGPPEAIPLRLILHQDRTPVAVYTTAGKPI